MRGLAKVYAFSEVGQTPLCKGSIFDTLLFKSVSRVGSLLDPVEELCLGKDFPVA